MVAGIYLKLYETILEPIVRTVHVLLFDVHIVKLYVRKEISKSKALHFV